jgi:hypothetical protein
VTPHDMTPFILSAPSNRLSKFVVDNKWVFDHTKSSETDEHLNSNNVLHPSDLVVNTMSSAAPNATTAALAGQVPKEESKSSVPGAFVETPSTEPSTFSVNPLPATSGGGNPISLAPGEKVPHPSTIGDKTIGNTVTLDKESYEAGSGAAATSAPDSSLFTVPPIQKGQTMIPESSLPMGSAATDGNVGPYISGIGSTATTVGLAGAVPLESSVVPKTVTESQHDAHVSPEASANPTAVEEKAEVEDELKSKVPEAAPTSESGFSTGSIAAAITGGAAAAAAVVTGAAFAAKEHATNLAANASSIAQGVVPPSEESKVAAAPTTIAASVPEVVKESIADAHKSPEAAGNPEAVLEKSAVEAELLKKVPEEEQAGEPAPTAAAVTSTKAPEATTDATPGPSTTTTAPTTTEPSTHKDQHTETPVVTSKKSKRQSILLKVKKVLHIDK